MNIFSAELLQAVQEGRTDAIIYDEQLTLTDENGWTLLHFAALFKNNTVVEHLLNRRAVVDAIDQHGWTPLMLAVSTTGAEDCAETLLQAGANVDATTDDGNSPLQQVLAGDSNIRLSQLCIQKARASFGDNAELWQKLIDGGCTAFHIAYTRDSTLLEQLALRGMPLNYKNLEDGLTAIHVAASYADFPMMEVLLRHGADAQALDSKHRCALHHLYSGRPANQQQQQQRLAILRMLLARGVPEDTVSLTLEGESNFSQLFMNGCPNSIAMIWNLAEKINIDDSGNSALHLMCANSMITNFITWHTSEFDVHAVNAYGQSTLWWAAKYGAAKNLQYLLGRGVDPNIPTRQGYTPLITILSIPNNELLPTHNFCVQLLLGKNADPQIRIPANNTHLSIIDIAQEFGNEELLRLIVKELARREAFYSGTLKEWMRRQISAEAELDAYYEENLLRERRDIIFKMLNLRLGSEIAERIYSFF